MKAANNSNWKLWVGLTLLIIIAVASLTSTLWLANDPYFRESLRLVPNEQGMNDFHKAPFPSSSENLIGTDQYGRDLFARIIVGAKMTFTLIIVLTVGKIVVSLPLGLIAGGGSRIIARITENWAFVFSGLPVLFAGLFIFNIPYFQPSQHTLWGRIFIMAAVIVLMEWARIALIIKGRTEQIMKEPYIEGAKVLGRSRLGILYHHVLRVIFPDIVVLFVFEAARSLMLIGSLAMFGIYFLDSIIVNNDPLPPAITGLTPEWGALLGESRNSIFSNPGMTFTISGVIVFMIILFNLIGEGLKDKFMLPIPKRSSIFSRLSMPTLSRTQKVFTALGVTVVIIGALSFYNMASTTAMTDNSGLITTKLTAIKDRFAGTKEAKNAALLIEQQWHENGLEPINDKFVSSATFSKTVEVDNDIFVRFNDEEGESYNIDNGIYPLKQSVLTGSVTAPPVELTEFAGYGRKEMDAIRDGKYDGKILIIPYDAQIFLDDVIYVSLAESNVVGVVLSDDKGQYNPSFPFNRMSSEALNPALLATISTEKMRFFPVFIVGQQLTDELFSSETVTLSYKTEKVEIVSQNVEAKIEGDAEARPIIFYTFYDSPTETDRIGNRIFFEESPFKNRDITAPNIGMLTEVARSILSSKDDMPFTYYFAAMDGFNGGFYGLKQWLKNHEDIMKKDPIMIEINEPLFESDNYDIEAIVTNMTAIQDMTAAERALSEASWKEGHVPLVDRGRLRYILPPDMQGDFKLIQVYADQEDMVPFINRFLDYFALELEKTK